MADSLLYLLRWPEESRRLTAKKKKNYFRTAPVCLFGGFLLVLFFFILYFFFFVGGGKGMKLCSQLSSSTVYNPCTKIKFFEELTVWGINTRLQPCVPFTCWSAGPLTPRASLPQSNIPTPGELSHSHAQNCIARLLPEAELNSQIGNLLVRFIGVGWWRSPEDLRSMVMDDANPLT